MKKLATLDDLLVHELQDLYDAEQQIVKALPKMAKAASATELQSAFRRHLSETEAQVERLEQVFTILGIPAKGRHCDGMAGLLKEGAKMIDEQAEPEVLDAALIGAAQKVEHYEIAGYGCVATYAQMLGRADVHELLVETLDEEETTDQRLSELAETLINVRAGGDLEDRVR
jgi:ferritin-like metal-binding protein YciE